MPEKNAPRKGSLQYVPRKRAGKFLPKTNWKSINTGKSLKGFIAYKAGMISIKVKDSTPNSMTKDQDIILPATILECPQMKIYSVRFYKNGEVKKDVLTGNFDKELKKKLKPTKKQLDNLDSVEDYDDVSVIVYSIPKKTNIKKSPDVTEVGLNGSVEEKMNFIKENLNKEISVSDLFEEGQLVDFRGTTKGKGFEGPVSRFGLKLKSIKSEKGQRRPGSLGPWHPARTTFRAAQAGQGGMHTRMEVNKKIISISRASEQEIKNIKNYGDVKSDYMIIYGSVLGPAKRQLLLTAPQRESKEQSKKSYELLEIKR